MKKHSCSTIIIEMQCIQMSIYQTDKRSESWKNMNVGRTMGLERPLCIGAHGVAVARDRVLFWTLKNGGAKGSDPCLKPKVSFIARSLAILSQIRLKYLFLVYPRYTKTEISTFNYKRTHKRMCQYGGDSELKATWVSLPETK